MAAQVAPEPVPQSPSAHQAAVQVGASRLQVATGAQTSEGHIDRTRELIRQLIEQLPATIADGLPSSAAEDQSQIIASQAASLASARQAMQLMLQLLEQSGLSMQDTQAGGQATPLVQPAAELSPASIQGLFHQLLHHVTQPQQEALLQDATVDQSQLLAAQAAELASARQAMQVMLQLLEQQAGNAAVEGPAEQAPGELEVPGQSAGTAAVGVAVQQALEATLQQLSAQIPVHHQLQVCPNPARNRHHMENNV